jgi:hypothetical protein
MQEDSKITVARTAYNGSTNDFELARYNTR